MTSNVTVPPLHVTVLPLNVTDDEVAVHHHDAEDTTVYLRQLDLFLAVLHLFCFIFGNLGNIIALRFFAAQRKDLSTCIYLCISLTDIVVSLLTLPVAISYIGHREPLLFGVKGFCTFWGSINTIVPHLSVFMVAVLSLSRTHSLLFPLHKIRRRSILILLGLYLGFLSVQAGIPLAIGISKMIYLSEDTYCYSDATNNIWRNVDTILDVVELGCPIIPVIFSCALSSFSILKSINISRCRTSSKLKISASITIIIFTLVYILFNIPVFVQFVLYIITLYKYIEYPGPLFSSLWMKAYSWNVVFVLCVALNATINPFIYFCRMHHFKNYVIGQWRWFCKVILLRKDYSRVQESEETRNMFSIRTELKSLKSPPSAHELSRIKTQYSIAESLP